MTALDRLLTAAERGEIDEICERRGVALLGIFGSTFRRMHDPDQPEPNDLDVSVSFAGKAQVLDLLDDLVALTEYDGIDLAVIDGAGPVLRAEGMTGIGLYERTPGLWAVTQMAALAEKRDTAHLRRMDLEALAG